MDCPFVVASGVLNPIPMPLWEIFYGNTNNKIKQNIMKKFLLSIFCCLMALVSVQAEDLTATLSFANKAQRTSFSNTQQIWAQNGVTFTNNKASSSNAVADYAGPVRLYQNSEIIVECSLGNITKIVFDCNSSSYATALKNSIGSTATTSVSSDKVTVTLDGSSNSFTIAKLTAQVRMDAVTVTYSASTGVSKPVTPILTAGSNFVGSMEVEISCATEDAAIYYTTDGTEPTEDSEAYTESFEITETTTVKAIAVNEAGESSVATAVYTRVAATPTISFDEATFEDYVEVTVAAAEGTAAYYTLNGKTPTEDCDECPATLTIKADATLQVIAYDEDGYASPIVKQVFKKAASGATDAPTGTATLVENAADLAVGDKVVIVGVNAGKSYALSTNQKSSNRGAVEVNVTGNSLELNSEVEELVLETGANAGTFAFKAAAGYLYAASSSGNQLKSKSTKDVHGSWTITIAGGKASVAATGSSNRNVMQFNYNSGSPLFACYSSASQTAVRIYKVNLASIEDYVLNVTACGWATLYLGYNVVIPDGVTCYVISEIGEKSVNLEAVEGNVLPANTAVIVEAEAGEYTFEVAEVADEVESIMAGTTKNEYITSEAYVLGIVDGEVGLYKAKMAGGVWLNNANKAYLPASAVANKSAQFFGFDWGGTTGIENVEVENAEVKAIYDLTGRRIEAITAPGIYIVGGKKVLVK